MTKSLNEYAKSKSTFVSIKTDDSYTAIYRGYKFIEKDSFGETKEYARYMLEDPEDKKIRTLDSMSGALAERMAKIEVGQTIKISRKGEGMDTKYSVEVLGKVEAPEGEIPIVDEDENA